MSYWNQTSFQGLAAIASYLASQPALHEFAQYCLYREKGLRKQALMALDRFIMEVTAWSFDERRELVDWLLRTEYENPSIHQLIAHPLREQVILPTLEEWIQRYPHDPVPLRWRGMIVHDQASLEKAVALDPHEVLARVVLFGWLVWNIEYATHHLPDTFLGDPADCIRWAEQARAYLTELPTEEKQRLEEELQEAMAPVHDWLAFLEEGGTDFAAWCKQRGRNYV